MLVLITYCLGKKGCEQYMAMPSHLWVRGFWERLNDEIYYQQRKKYELAEQCGFDKRVLYGNCNISLPNLAKLCKELDVSADYLLFGK